MAPQVPMGPQPSLAAGGCISQARLQENTRSTIQTAAISSYPSFWVERSYTNRGWSIQRFLDGVYTIPSAFPFTPPPIQRMHSESNRGSNSCVEPPLLSVTPTGWGILGPSHEGMWFSTAPQGPRRRPIPPGSLRRLSPAPTPPYPSVSPRRSGLSVPQPPSCHQPHPRPFLHLWGRRWTPRREAPSHTAAEGKPLPRAAEHRMGQGVEGEHGASLDEGLTCRLRPSGPGRRRPGPEGWWRGRGSAKLNPSSGYPLARKMAAPRGGGRAEGARGAGVRPRPAPPSPSPSRRGLSPLWGASPPAPFSPLTWGWGGCWGTPEEGRFGECAINAAFHVFPARMSRVGSGLHQGCGSPLAKSELHKAAVASAQCQVLLCCTNPGG